MNGLHTVVLVVDKFYKKSARLARKLRLVVGCEASVVIAVVDGFGAGEMPPDLSEVVDREIRGTIAFIARKLNEECHAVCVVALNQSALVPSLALMRAMKMPEREWILGCCDKAKMRWLMHGSDALYVEFATASPGGVCVYESVHGVWARSACIMKPSFGMSSRHVRKCATLRSAMDAAACVDLGRWFPDNVTDVLAEVRERERSWLFEPYVEGVEFSVDGWVFDGDMRVCVQHKLCVFNREYRFEDGPTVSPPLSEVEYEGYQSLNVSEEMVNSFAAEVLRRIGVRRGVFHIEARQSANGDIVLLEVNPRSPGGALWKTFLLRTGYDLEICDAQIQVGSKPTACQNEIHPFVMHYPIYAGAAGVLTDVSGLSELVCDRVCVDFAVDIGHVYTSDDMYEEPYLAFVVSSASSAKQILADCALVRASRAPVIV